MAFHFFALEYGQKVHVDVLRGKERMSFDVPVAEPPRDTDQVAAPADPEKSLVSRLGILAAEIDQRIAAWSPTVRDRFGVFVAARAAGATVELPLLAGEVIRTPNRQPMTALDRLRGALKSLPPGATAALQMQRDQKLLVGRFYP